MKFILGDKLIYRYMYSRDMYDDKLGIMYIMFYLREWNWLRGMVFEYKIWLVL